VAASPYRRGAPVLAFLVAAIAAGVGAMVIGARRPPAMQLETRVEETSAPSSQDEPSRPTRGPLTVPVVTEPGGAAVFAVFDGTRTRVCSATPCSFVVTGDRVATTTVSMELPDRAPVKAWVRDVADVPGGGTLMVTFPPRSEIPHERAPAMLRQGLVDVDRTRLPPEVVQRIVRQSFGRFRLCYEAGLRRKPSISGRVTAHFVIARDGSVASVVDRSSDLDDREVVECVLRWFGTLSFPQPEHGVAVVDYSILFNPPDA
jgi:hypothetical protein